MSSDDSDGGYVHRPGESAPDDKSTDSPEGFGRRGWILVAVVVLSVLVIPGIVYLYPVSPSSGNIPFLVAMLALPMLPAVLLGATAVWSMTAASRGRD